MFDPDGNWVRSVGPAPMLNNPPGTAKVLADGQIVLGVDNRFTAEDPATFPQRYTVLTRHNPTGELVDTIGRFANGRYGQVTPADGAMFIFPLFESFLTTEARGERLVIGHTSGTELRVHRYPDLPPERYSQMVEPLISDARPVAEQFPAFGQLRIGTDDKIWIRE